MKTREELDPLKSAVKPLDEKLAELNEDELEQICGGIDKTQANEAVKVAETALQRVLNQQAAIETNTNRLEFECSNLSLNHENLQIAENNDMILRWPNI